jgi:hypothetical protein
MTKQSSSVEWLFEELFNSFEKFNNGEFSFAKYMAHNLKLREQAKEKHKDEIEDAASNHCYPTCGLAYKEAQEYYKEVFGGNNEERKNTSED